MKIKSNKTINDFVTINEIAEEIKTTTANIRMQIKNKSIPERFFRKLKGTYIFDKDFIEYHKEYKSKNKCKL